MGRVERIWCLSLCSPEPNWDRGWGAGGAEDDYPGPDCTIWRGGEEGRVLLLLEGSTPLVLTILLPLSFLFFLFCWKKMGRRGKWVREVKMVKSGEGLNRVQEGRWRGLWGNGVCLIGLIEGEWGSGRLRSYVCWLEGLRRVEERLHEVEGWRRVFL